MRDWPPRKRVPVLGLCLGLVVGALEVGMRSTTMALHLSFAQGLLLSLVAAVCMGFLAGLTGWAAGAVVERLTTDKEEAWRHALGLSLVGLCLGAFYFLPMAEEARDSHGLHMVVGLAILPLPAAGMVYQLALFYLRHEVEDPQKRRFGWTHWASGATVLLSLASATQFSTTHYGGSEAISTDPTIVVLSIDTLRRDHVSAYGESPVETPHLDALASRGLLFTDAVSPMPETAPAHAAMMTGLHPLDSGVLSNGHILAEGHTTLAERLGDEGYATGAFVSSIPVAARTGLDQGFQVYDDDFFPWVRGFSSLTLARILSRLAMTLGDPTDYPYLLERPAPVTFDRALDWLTETSDRPSFAWVHLFDPHSPYEPHGLVGHEDNGTVDEPALDHRDILKQEPGYSYTEAERERLRALYAEEVAWTDQQIGAFVEQLEQTLADRDWILIITSDHGEMLGEHGIDFNHHGIYEDAIRVPLMVVTSGIELEPGVFDGQARLMDLPTTVLGMLSIEGPELGVGVDLRQMDTGAGRDGMASILMGRKTASLSMGTLYGMRVPVEGDSARYKYIDDPDEGDLLFEVDSDPEESVNLAEDSEDIVRRLRDEVRARTRAVEGAGGSSPEVRDDVQEQLEAIGYSE